MAAHHSTTGHRIIPIISQVGSVGSHRATPFASSIFPTEYMDRDLSSKKNNLSLADNTLIPVHLLPLLSSSTKQTYCYNTFP